MIGITVEADRATIAYFDQGGTGIRAIVRAGATDDGGLG
jgi:hypothetical protein